MNPDGKNMMRETAADASAVSTPVARVIVCAKCGKPWPCDMAGLYPHRKRRARKVSQ